MNSKERHAARRERRTAKREARITGLNQEYGDFEKVFSFDNLYNSYKKCCNGVGWKASTQRFRANALLNINNIHRELMTGKYKSKGFYEFDIYERGKPRHIKSVHISERVVQRCLCDNALVPMFQRSFIYDNGASMKYKGIDFALDRLNCHLQRHYKEHGNEGYALVIDFSKFFDRIKHEPLIREINNNFTDKRVVDLAVSFIKAFGDEGLGLGSQVSQICALMYPSRIDHFIKENLRVKRYARYMDDSYLIHPDKKYLQYCLAEIKKKCDEFGIVLNPKKTQIIKLTRGMTFLKMRFRLSDTGRVIRKVNPRGIGVMRRKLKKFKTWLGNGKFTMRDIETSYRSWQGHVKRCDSYTTRKSMDKTYNSLFSESGPPQYM